jgi:hypothetical protein
MAVTTELQEFRLLSIYKYPVTQGVAPMGVYEVERADYPLINSATGEAYKAFRLRQIRLALQPASLDWLSYCPGNGK